MPLNRLPHADVCCGCVTDLKTATAIIAVLGIVTSPAVSWAVVRHSFVIRVACFISSSLTRPDVVDINLNNILSFGFGANAGLGPSCLSVNRTKPDPKTESALYPIFRASEEGSKLVTAVRYVGWVVLISDLVFVFCSIFLLLCIFRGPVKKAAKIFIIAAIVTMILSFIYGMMYVSACIKLGGAFPVFEFLFSFVDLFKWIIWIHFVLVIHTYAYTYKPLKKTPDRWLYRWITLDNPNNYDNVPKGSAPSTSRRGMTNAGT